MKATIYLIYFLCLLLMPPALWAQGMDYLEDDNNSLWESDSFVDPSQGRGEDSNAPGSAAKSKDYIAEEEVQAMESAAQQQRGSNLNLAFDLEQAKLSFGANVVYGVSTGAILGIMVSLDPTKNFTAREKAQKFGTGAVMGVLLATAVGGKNSFSAQADPHPPAPLFDPKEGLRAPSAMAMAEWNWRF